MTELFVAHSKFPKNAGYAAISVGCLFFAFYLVDLATFKETLFSVPHGTLAWGALLILASILFAFIRFRIVLASFGYLPGWRDSFVAFSFGQAANLMFLNIIGQSLSRAAVLSQANVPAGVSVIVTYWERGLATAVLFLLSVAGGWFLFANDILHLQTAAPYLVYVFGSLILVSAIVAVTILGPTVALARAKHWVAVVFRTWPSLALTLLSQICMLSAYLVILIQTSAQPVTLVIISAIAVVMFAASLPVSFSGWGVRELGSVQILGAIGFTSSISLATAIAIGLISLVVLVVFTLLGLWFFVRRRESAAPAAIAPNVGSGIEWMSLTALLIGLSTAVLIFFQVRIATDGGAVTANVSDVIAVTALGFAVFFISRHRSLSVFPSFFSWGLLAISGVLALAIYIGWSRYGLNQWALVNRGVGWIVILGYLAAGGALAWVDNSRGRVLVLRCFALAGASVAGIELVLLMSSLFSVQFPLDTFVYPLRGYAGNSNAFSLQMILVAIAAVTVHRLGAGFCNRGILRVILVVTGLATFYSLSRSGLGTYLGALFLFVVFSSREERRERLIDGLLVVAAIVMAFSLPDIVSTITEVASQAEIAIRPDRKVLSHLDFVVARESSDNLRWQSIAEGWNLWLQYPLFGGGLGAFVQNRTDADLPALIIHSIPVWILAELGIFGFVVIFAVFIGILGLSLKMIRNTGYFAWGAGLLVLLAAIAVSGSVHDFFFQRGFWFLLGIFVGAYGKADLQTRRLREPSINQRSPAIRVKEPLGGVVAKASS